MDHGLKDSLAVVELLNLGVRPHNETRSLSPSVVHTAGDMPRFSWTIIVPNAPKDDTDHKFSELAKTFASFTALTALI